MPDLPYFLKIPVTAHSWHEPFVNATFSHSFRGLLLVGLPSAVFITFLFHIARRPVGDLCPLRLRLHGYGGTRRRGRLSFGIWFPISALVGLTTHLVWDAMTQGGSWLAANQSLFQVNQAAGHTIDRLLQHASTVIGVLVIVVWCMRRLRSHEMSIEWDAVSRAWAMKRIAIASSIVVASAGLAAYSVVEVRDRDGALGVELTLSLFLKSGMRIAAVAVVIYALLWHAACFTRQFMVPGTKS